MTERRLGHRWSRRIRTGMRAMLGQPDGGIGGLGAEMGTSTEDAAEQLVALAYPVSARRAIVLGSTEAIEALGKVEEPVGRGWMEVLRSALGTSGEAANVALAADGRFVQLTAESVALLKHGEAISAGGSAFYGVVRDAGSKQFMGNLSFVGGSAMSMATALPGLLGAVALQAQLAAIEKKLDEVLQGIDYLIDQSHREVEADLVSSITILDDAFAHSQRLGRTSDDDWASVAAIQHVVISRHRLTSGRLEDLSETLEPGGSVGDRLKRLRLAMTGQEARFWLAAHAQAELALTKLEWIRVMRRASSDDDADDELLRLLEATEEGLLRRRAALEGLAGRLGAFTTTGEENLLDRLLFWKRKQLGDLVAELSSIMSAFRTDVAPLGIDVHVPIALGTGEEEATAWHRLVEQLQDGRGTATQTARAVGVRVKAKAEALADKVRSDDA